MIRDLQKTVLMSGKEGKEVKDAELITQLSMEMNRLAGQVMQIRDWLRDEKLSNDDCITEIVQLLGLRSCRGVN